jgi:RHS repeat-associated protein
MQLDWLNEEDPVITPTRVKLNATKRCNAVTARCYGVFAYTGREWDKETGLYYYRARYYEPMDGRFVSKDPIGFRGGINYYAYARGNPILYRDPKGLDVRVENTSQVLGLHQRITVDIPGGGTSGYFFSFTAWQGQKYESYS